MSEYIQRKQSSRTVTTAQKSSDYSKILPIIPQYYAKMLSWPIISKIILNFRLSPNGMHAELIDSWLALINAAPCILYIITSCIYRTSSKNLDNNSA